MIKFIISIIFIVFIIHYIYRRFKFILLFKKTRRVFKELKKNDIIQNEDKTACFQEKRLEKWRRFSRELYLMRYQDVVNIIKDQGRKSLKILDIGCSDAYLFKQLMRAVKKSQFMLYNLYGLDISKDRIFLAKKRFKGINNTKFILGDAENLPFSDNEFDMVISHESLEHLINPIKGVKEVKRILKPDGIFILSVPSKHMVFISRINPLTWIEGLMSVYFPFILPPFHNLYEPEKKNTVIHRAFTFFELKQSLYDWDKIEIKTTDFLFEEFLPQKLRNMLRHFYYSIKILKMSGRRILVLAKNKK